MKKIVMTEYVRELIAGDKTLLNRTGMKTFIAASNDEALHLHRKEKADLIMAGVDSGALTGEQLCALIREDRELRNVSVIIICPDTPEGRERGSRCRANEVLFLPVEIPLLTEKALQLLSVAWRKSMRVLLNMTAQSDGQLRSFFCRSEDISTAGLLIETDRQLAIGDRVSCSFTLSGSVEVRASGEVVRIIRPPLDSNLNRYGIKFIDLSGSAKAAIESFAAEEARPPV
jgi:response regulator RpfG family c-di-GMP phosphodiesterase